MIDILDIETKQVYQINPQRSGENAMPCPKCSPTRKKKTEKCFSWNTEREVGQCLHCNSAFVMYKVYQPHQAKDFVIPEWKNKTDLTDDAVKWFEGRMISQEALRKMQVYSDRELMPQYKKDVKTICFPYFRDGKQVNIKSRGPQKTFKLVSGAELPFYNIDCVKETKQLVIVEGEMDALSFIEVGIPHVVSVPNGASSKDLPYLDSCIDRLDHIETFYIATDQDEPGIKLRNELVRRLGAEKCKIVHFGDCKDANELLCHKGGLSLKEAYKNAVELPINGVLDLQSCYNDIRLVFEHGLGEGKSIGVDPIDNLVKWRTGLLSIWTGIPSHGKSEILNFMAARWNKMFGWKVAYFSPENMPYQRYLYPKLASVITGKEFKSGKLSETEFEECFDYIADNFKFIDSGDDYSVETVIDSAKQLVRRYGVKVLIIDPYNCFEHRQDKGETETQYIGRFLDTLARFAKKYDVLVNLVAHPKKMEKLQTSNIAFSRPALYDINGSANFYNKADIGVTIYRRFNDHPQGAATEFIVTKVRFKELGETGSNDLFYNLQNGRYSPPIDDIYNLDNSSYLSHKNTGLNGLASAGEWSEKSDLPF